jgi:VanZ family protein
VSKLRVFLKYWLPVLIWIALIFSASADTQSYEHSAALFGLFEPFLHWLFPQMSPEQIGEIHHLFRKFGHLTEYAVLALLLWRAVGRRVKHDPRPWSWRAVRLVLLMVMLFAATDEFHQSFVSNRTSLVSDVFIDTAGGAAGLFALWTFGRWRNAGKFKK